MGIKRYSIKESLNRIYRLLSSVKNVTSDQPESVPEPVYSEDEAFSRIAELLATSLDGETANVPSAFVASVADANAGSANDKVMTPQSHTWAHEYGGIYVATGTVQQSLTQDTWTKITGAFQNFMLDSGGEVFCDWNDDRIVIYETGNWLVSWQLSLFSPDGGLNNLEVQSYVNGTAQPQTRSEVQFDVSGSVTSMSAFGSAEIVSGTAVDLRARAGGNITIQVATGQIFVEKQNG
jgi:hypothetical protein